MLQQMKQRYNDMEAQRQMMAQHQQAVMGPIQQPMGVLNRVPPAPMPARPVVRTDTMPAPVNHPDLQQARPVPMQQNPAVSPAQLHGIKSIQFHAPTPPPQPQPVMWGGGRGR